MFIKKASIEKRLNIAKEHLERHSKLTDKTEFEQEEAEKEEEKLSLFDQYRILCIIGTHCISYCTLDAQGNLKLEDGETKAPGRIVRYQDNQFYKSGVIMLLDSQEDTDDFKI